MNRLFVLSVLFSLSLGVPLPSPDAEPDAAPAAYASDYTHYVPAQVVADPPASQYHAQDDAGQYNFGFASTDQTKQEIKTADGVVRGAYSYIDADGLTQTVNYIADALGFRVDATNLPVHNIGAVDAPVEPVAPVESAAYIAPVAPAAPVPAQVISPEVNYAYLPYATNYAYSQPIAYAEEPTVTQVTDPAPAPVAAPAVAPVHQAVDAAPSSQYHAQDDIGQYNYGYSGGNSIKQEVKTADGVTRGSYSYVDANGLVQTVNYISDAMGFRVAATNLPVHNVGDTSENSVVEAQVPYSYLPYAQGYGYNLPVTAGAA